MDVATTLRAARRSAGLTQGALAAWTGTSQATVSAYEHGAKEPGVATFSRLLAACGAHLEVRNGGRPVRQPSAAELARVGRGLEAVMELAEALPVRHEPELRYPRLPASA